MPSTMASEKCVQSSISGGRMCVRKLVLKYSSFGSRPRLQISERISRMVLSSSRVIWLLEKAPLFRSSAACFSTCAEYATVSSKCVGKFVFAMVLAISFSLSRRITLLSRVSAPNTSILKFLTWSALIFSGSVTATLDAEALPVPVEHLSGHVVQADQRGDFFLEDCGL